MEYRRMGRSGLKLSALSYGSWVSFHNQVDISAAAELMQAAYDAGVNFFDNAEVYARGESETVMGAAQAARLATRQLHGLDQVLLGTPRRPQ
jgi:aryl-alcohol dehydrogenase-like predicted oxidoreductase